MRQCLDLRNQIVESQPSRDSIKLLDSMSNLLSQVADSAELCRSVHSDPSFVEAADAVHNDASGLIYELNSDVDLYQALMRVINDQSIWPSLTEVEKRVASLFREDFERGGIHFDSATRSRFTSLSHEIDRLGFEFVRNVQGQGQPHPNDVITTISIPVARLKGLPDSFLSRFPKAKRPLKAPHADHPQNWVLKGFENATEFVKIECGQGGFSEVLLKHVGDETVRKAAFVLGNQGPTANLAVLDKLLAKRSELARLMGFGSFAEYQLSKAEQDPASVHDFLSELSSRLEPKAQRELAVLQSFKTEIEGPNSGPLGAWDRSYFTGIASATKLTKGGDELKEYFSLEACLNGLSLVCRSLFGVELVNTPLGQGEGWSPEVQKLSVRAENGSPLGTIYLDLFPRQGKFDFDALFSVQCGVGDTLPVVALVCTFTRSGRKLHLTHGEVQNLFHEFGHALHNMLGRTNFQAVSGTRTSLALAETPSNLFEYFACDPRVLSLFAKRRLASGATEALPLDIAQKLFESQRMFAATSQKTQIIYSLMDLAYHGPPPSPSCTTSVLRDIHNKHSPFPFVEGTRHNTSFSHISGYGAQYNSYVFAKVYSAQIWQKYFAADPLSRKAGEALRTKFLALGGSRSPRATLHSILEEAPDMQHFLKQIDV